MSIYNATDARSIAREPAKWVNPDSFPSSIGRDVVQIAQTLAMMTPREFPVDRVEVTTADPASPPPDAAPYPLDASTAVADTPYQFAGAAPERKIYGLKLVTSGYELPINLQEDLFDGRYEQDEFLSLAIVNAVRAEVERQLIVGDSVATPNEFSGFLAADFPRQQLNAASVASLEIIDQAIQAVNLGSGQSRADAIFCHQRVGLQLAKLMRDKGFAPPSADEPRLAQRVLAVPSAQGWVPVIYNNFFPVANVNESSLIVLQLRGPNAVFLAVPEGTPNVRKTVVRIPDRPASFCIAEWKGALISSNSFSVVEIQNFPVL